MKRAGSGSGADPDLDLKLVGFTNPGPYQNVQIHNTTQKYGMQCSGSMTFWCGSRSAEQCLWLMDQDADPDPAIFVIDL